MRIGLIAPPWIPVPPPSYGGIEAVVDALAAGLTEAGHEVILAAAGDSTCPVPLVPASPPSTAVSMDSGRQELLHILRAYAAMTKVDAIHDHTLLGPVYRLPGPQRPRVATLHGPVDGELRRIYGAMRPESALVAISRHQAWTARDLGIAAVIHHGIDVRTVPYSPTHGGGACFLGRMHPDKGVLQAIHAARRAGMRLRIGAKMRDAFEQAYFREVIKPQLGHGIDYLGELTAAEKYQLLGESVALLNPIQWPEPFGMVMIEALAAGTPVVATPRGSAPEIIDDGQTGFLADSLPGLAQGLREAFGLDRAVARNTAERRFSARRMVEDYLTLYRALMDKPATRTDTGVDDGYALGQSIGS